MIIGFSGIVANRQTISENMTGERIALIPRRIPVAIDRMVERVTDLFDEYPTHVSG